MFRPLPMVRTRHSERGSLLIVAMIISAVIGIALASYLQLSRTSLRISNRAFYQSTAMNLAENGLEEAMYALNLSPGEQIINWQSWTTQAGTAWREFPSASTSYPLDAAATGSVRVRIENYGSNLPVIIARATVTLADGSAPIEKWVKVTAQRTSIFANGIVAKSQIVFRGATSNVDSWNSDPDNDSSTANVPYSTAVRSANGTVASAAVEINQVMIRNAQIRGFVATAGAAPFVGSLGLIGDLTTAAGTVVAARVSNDFVANFPAVTEPPPPPASQPTLPAITGNSQLPRPTDTPVMIEGVPTYSYRTAQLNLNNNTLRIRKSNPNTPDFNVVLTITNETNSVSVSGSGQIVISSGTSLHVYAGGDVNIGGLGVLNGGADLSSVNPPVNFQLWGTRTQTRADQFGPQAISLSSNGVLSSVVYAPFGSLTISGNGDLLGSVVANDITFTGNASFHFDEALGRFSSRAAFQNQPFRILSWQELTNVSARNTYASTMAF